jgi:hypothetical protein
VNRAVCEGLFNTLKIVGLKRYDDVHSKIGK